MKSKAELRAAAKTELGRMTDSARAKASARLCHRLMNETAPSLGIYLPLPDEPDLTEAYRMLLEQGRSLAMAYPSDGPHWSFHQIERLKIETRDRYGIPYPQAGPEVRPDDLDMILVPGVAFTREGKRLGRGKGIYDRLLAGTTARKIGICFECQLVDDLPLEATDVRMDEVWWAGSE